jgi:hypothetical protein
MDPFAGCIAHAARIVRFLEGDWNRPTPSSEKEDRCPLTCGQVPWRVLDSGHELGARRVSDSAGKGIVPDRSRWGGWGSNPRPTDYESVAEVPAHCQQDHVRWKPESRKRRRSRVVRVTTNHPGTLRPHPIVNATVPPDGTAPRQQRPRSVQEGRTRIGRDHRPDRRAGGLRRDSIGLEALRGVDSGTSVLRTVAGRGSRLGQAPRRCSNRSALDPPVGGLWRSRSRCTGRDGCRATTLGAGTFSMSSTSQPEAAVSSSTSRSATSR